MSLQNKLAIVFVSFAAIALAGCAVSVNDQAVAPANGAFNNSNLNGTYVVAFTGTDNGNANPNYFAMTGIVTANGNGSLTGGAIDLDDPALGSALKTGYVFADIPVSGNYSITPDGRGNGSISLSINGAQVQFGLDFVLTSSNHGMITRFDNNGSGSGTIDLQQPALSQSALQGSYSFGLGGVDSGIVNPLSAVGSFTLDGKGNVISGIEDLNDNGNSSELQALPIQGAVLLGSPGSAQLRTSAPGLGTLRFDVWPIDSTHLKFVETDSMAFLAGDAFVSTGQTAFPSGPLVFTLSGEDTTQGPFVAGGLLTSDGSSQIQSGLEDINDEGFVAQAPSVSGNFTSDGVRSVLTLNGIYNGNITSNVVSGSYTFAAYPYSGGIVLLEIDGGAGSTLGISSGTIYTQSATALIGQQSYGLNLSGANTFGEADWIAEFTASGNVVSGLYDANNSGSLISGYSLGSGGSYTVGPNGRGTMQFPGLQMNGSSIIPALNLTFYVLDSSTAVFIETDGNQLATGAFQAQDATNSPVAGLAHATSMRPPMTAQRNLPAIHR
jgi:hypothetical protein